MLDELEPTFEFHAGVTELRDSLGFTVRHVAESGEPCIVSRYGRACVAIVPLDEWRRLKQLEVDLTSGGLDCSLIYCTPKLVPRT